VVSAIPLLYDASPASQHVALDWLTVLQACVGQVQGTHAGPVGEPTAKPRTCDKYLPQKRVVLVHPHKNAAALIHLNQTLNT